MYLLRMSMLAGYPRQATLKDIPYRNCSHAGLAKNIRWKFHIGIHNQSNTVKYDVRWSVNTETAVKSIDIIETTIWSQATIGSS